MPQLPPRATSMVLSLFHTARPLHLYCPREHPCPLPFLSKGQEDQLNSCLLVPPGCVRPPVHLDPAWKNHLLHAGLQLAIWG
jgi:hypothetical protein